MAARKLLKDWPIAAAILDGTYDEDLHVIEQAVNARRKHMDRLVGAKPGSRFIVLEGKEYGREGTIVKINPKRYVVHLDEDNVYREWSFPKSMLEVAPASVTERVAALKSIGRLPNGSFDYTSATVMSLEATS